MIKSYYVCDICGARVDADTISNYNVMFKKVTLKAETIPPTLPYSKTIDVCRTCLDRLFNNEDQEEN